jgi:16S rRNA (guanine527-N7)-methyltransferase
LASAGLEQPAETLAGLGDFLDLLVRWNRVYNLTGLRDVDALIERHVVESLALQKHLRGQRIADVGTGAGLPGVPLAIAERNRQFTLIESRAKRVRFLRHVVGSLRLANAAIEHGRAELLRVEPFTTVLARAVAPPAELLAICRHLTAPGSILLLLTATHLEEEFRDLAPDFALRPVEGAAEGLRGSIVMLERMDV